MQIPLDLRTSCQMESVNLVRIPTEDFFKRIFQTIQDTGTSQIRVLINEIAV